MTGSTVAATLRATARDRGEHALLVCDSDRLSYATAELRSARLARGLLALDVARGTHVGLLAPNGSDFVCWMLAAARIGAVVVPFTTFATARELRQQLADADIAILLSVRGFRSHDYAARLAEVRAGGGLPSLRHIVFDDELLCAAGESVSTDYLPAVEDDVTGADTLAIVYTSGSASTPKGAVHTHAALLDHQRNLNGIRGLTAEDRLFCNSPFFWIGGFGFGLLATLVAGATLVCSNAVDAADTLDLLEAERPTLTNGFAGAIAHLGRHPSIGDRDLTSMRRGNLYPIMAPDARPADPELRHNMLGMTEAGGTYLLSGDESDQPEAQRGSYGTPAPGFETTLVGDGELCIRGPYVMQRYHRRSREECFDADGWFHTGDLVRVDGDGFIHYLGRAGAMIKTAGANVSPVEVATAITRVTGGCAAHVLGLPDPERGQLVAAVIALPDGHAFDEKTLRADLSRELSSYKIPRRIVAVPSADLPLLSSGKVDVRALPGLFDA
jgi:acyl-CoA synthetase (AMP-forming)/AMP-acid ligase II